MNLVSCFRQRFANAVKNGESLIDVEEHIKRSLEGMIEQECLSAQLMERALQMPEDSAARILAESLLEEYANGAEDDNESEER